MDRTYFGGGKLWGAARKSDHHHATSILRTGDLVFKPSRMPRGCKIPQFPQICIEFDRNVQDLLKISIILFESLSTYSCTWEKWSLHTYSPFYCLGDLWRILLEAFCFSNVNIGSCNYCVGWTKKTVTFTDEQCWGCISLKDHNWYSPALVFMENQSAHKGCCW